MIMLLIIIPRQSSSSHNNLLTSHYKKANPILWQSIKIKIEMGECVEKVFQAL